MAATKTDGSRMNLLHSSPRALVTGLIATLLLAAWAAHALRADDAESAAGSAAAGDSSKTADGTAPTLQSPEREANPTVDESSKLAQATFASGCFWCTEAIFQQARGVVEVVSGYTGGSIANPTYKEVCSGTTGHAEGVLIRYDPQKISYAELLEMFWKTHDPTTLNQQGYDVGTQYRSAIFYHDEQQRQLAETYKEKLDASGAFDRPIVTEIVAAAEFYPARRGSPELLRAEQQPAILHVSNSSQG